MLAGVLVLHGAVAQLPAPERVPGVVADEVPGLTPAQRRQVRYEKRIDSYRAGWSSLIPRYTKVQFAGSMGLISAGFGWDYGRKKQWETDFFLGFIPRFSSGEAKMTMTLKQNYIPWSLRLGGRWFLEPLETGLYINTVMDDDFWRKEPEKYPSNYYKFSTRVRFNIFLGQRITWDMGSREDARKMTFFYEVSTCELYLISAFTNKYLKAEDIIGLSVGIKWQLL